MAIVVETGSGANPAANSYTSLADFVTWATERGLTLPAGDPAREALLYKAMDYLNVQDWLGARAVSGQPLSWPRSGVSYDATEVAANSIPVQIKQAQFQLAFAAVSVDLMPTVARNEPTLASKRIGPIAKSWHAPRAGGSQSVTPILTAVRELLSPFLKAGFALKTVRV